MSNSPGGAQRLARIHAALLGALMAATVVSIVWPPAALGAGVLTLAGGAVGLLLIRAGQLTASLVLLGVGLVAGAVALALGAEIGVDALAGVNQDLVAMLAGVSFLRLLAADMPEGRSRLRGGAAVARTAVLTHLFGAVVSMSAVTIVAERLRGTGKLTLPDAALVSRSFGAGAFWSPFWVATAAAAAVVPGSDPRLIGLVGVVTAAVALTVSHLDLRTRYTPEAWRDYTGYAFTWPLLKLPLALVALVTTLHLVLPDTAVPKLVLVAAVVVTTVVAVATRRLGAVVRHAVLGISQIRAEATMFAAAGVLTVGLGSLLAVLDVGLPVPGYGWLVAWGGSITIVVASVLGVHPVVSVGLVGALVASLDPDPTLFGLAAAVGWGVSAAVGPTSGLCMYLAAGFGVDARRLIAMNLPFAFVTVGIGVAPIAVVATVLGIGPLG